MTFGIGEVGILCHNEMKYGTEQGHFLGQEKLTYARQILGLNEVIFLGQEKLILSLFKMNYGT